jgi:broad specificity phosphatase PhoE
LILARHALAEHFNGEGYAVFPGPCLTSEGRRQARDMAAVLRGEGIRMLYASPYLRCQQTAQTIGETLQLTVHTCPAIKERDVWEGLAGLYERVGRFVDYAVALDGPVLLVTHGGPMLAVLDHLYGHYDRSLCAFDGDSPCAPSGILRLAETKVEVLR